MEALDGGRSMSNIRAHHGVRNQLCMAVGACAGHVSAGLRGHERYIITRLRVMGRIHAWRARIYIVVTCSMPIQV